MTPIERRIRISAILVIIGLLIEGASFLWSSPLSFFLFLIFACGFAAAGIIIYLASLAGLGGHAAPGPSGESGGSPARPAPPRT